MRTLAHIEIHPRSQKKKKYKKHQINQLQKSLPNPQDTICMQETLTQSHSHPMVKTDKKEGDKEQGGDKKITFSD